MINLQKFYMHAIKVFVIDTSFTDRQCVHVALYIKYKKHISYLY